MSDADEKLSYKSLSPHIKNMRNFGIYRIDQLSPKLIKILHTIYMRFNFFFVALYILQQLINLYQVRHDADKMTDSMFLLLTFFDSICKQLFIWIKSNDIDELLEIMKGPSFNQDVEEHKVLLAKTIKQSHFLLRLFNRITLSTCLLWAVFPIISHIKQETVEFAAWLPFEPNKNPQFYLVVFYIWMQTSWLGINNSTMDIFITFLFAQARTQFSILRYDLEMMVERSKYETDSNNNSQERVLEQRFIRVMQHYNDIVRFSNKIQSIFNVPILFQFLVSGWIICTTAYKTVNMRPASVEFLSMLLYMVCILSELFLFCFYGNEVAYESNLLPESAYSMTWVNLPVKHRRFLIIFMERIKRPVIPTTCSVVPLSLSTFVSILKTSYTFYTILKNSQQATG